METRGIVAEYDAATGRYTLTLGTQGGHGMRDIIAKDILKIDPKQDPRHHAGRRRRLRHQGASAISEYPLAAIAAKQLGRPVKWIGDRTEHFLVDAHGRDNIAVAEMAMDANGKFLAHARRPPRQHGRLSVAVRAVHPAMAASPCRPASTTSRRSTRVCRGVYTNTVPVDAYRGAGRPEAAYLVERLVDVCGRDTGLGPIEIRRRNFIRPRAAALRDAGRAHLR